MKNGPRQDSRRFLSHVLDKKGWTAARLAREIGVVSTTITRLLNDESHKSGLSVGTIQKIEVATGIAAASFFSKTRQAGDPEVPPGRPPCGVREEGAPYDTSDGSQGDLHRSAVDALLRQRPDAHAWTVKSDILILKGVRAGDIAIFDRSIAARNGDIVCAQIEEGLGARTVFRVYQAPNLLGAALDPSAVRIETVDGERVRIAGVMTELLRRRA